MVLVLCIALQAAAGSKQVIDLDRKLESLKSDFNAHQDNVRLVFIVGPTCDVCRKGLKNMKEVVMDNISPDSNLSVFVIHVPALDAAQGDIESTYSLFDDPRAVHYWDGFGTSGIRFQRTLDLPIYAWDV